MRPTRRYWAVAVMTVLLAVSAMAFDRPALLAGTAALGGWLVASAFAFLLTVTSVEERIDLEVTVSERRAVVDDGVEVTLRGTPLEGRGTTTARLRLPSGLSTGASESAATIRLVDSMSAETTVEVDTPVAGRFTLPRPEITVTDAKGLFVQRFDRGPAPTLTVEPRYPHDLSVGAGDRQFSTVGGQRSSERRGQGIEPGEIRKYVPGETADRIDWNATARLGETYVRNFEAESALETAFVVDARSTTRTGPDGETAFDYLREVALGLLKLSRSVEDPVGLAAVDDDGLAFLQQPTNAPGGYDRVRRRLHTLAPGTGRGRPDRRLDSGSSLAARLDGVRDEDGAFLETLSACVAERRPLPTDRSPLRSAVQALGDGTEGRIVVFTDDTNRREVREVIEAARDAARSVTVFLAPSVLYEPGSLADLPAAYERYSEFETFRRELDRLDRVSAFEVGPGERRDRLRSAEVAETA